MVHTLEGQQAFLMQMQMMQVKRMMATRPPRRSLEEVFAHVLSYVAVGWEGRL